MKRVLVFALIPLLLGCKPKVNNEPKLNANGWQDLDMGAFKISVPPNWKYQQQQGIDSFVGEIKGPGVSLSFDFSGMGYANSLLPSEQEYLKAGERFYKVGVTYTANFNVKNEIAVQMKKLGTIDSTLVHVEADPSYETKTNIHLPTTEQKIQYPKADYIVDLTYRDSTILIPIEIPIAIKTHHIQIDTTDKYIIKTIWPKVPSKGVTGVYYKSRSSTLNFQMSASNLSKQDQDLALQAFKTIVIKK